MAGPPGPARDRAAHEEAVAAELTAYEEEQQKAERARLEREPGVWFSMNRETREKTAARLGIDFEATERNHASRYTPANSTNPDRS